MSRFHAACCILIALATPGWGQAQTTRPGQPRLFTLRPEQLAEAKRRLAAGDQTLAPAIAALHQSADAALAAGPFSVMQKKAVPPSGDKHDYMSLGTYWWPDPEKSDGRPYIRRDGYVNPEGQKLDFPRLRKMAESVEALALGYYFTGEERYAAHAAKLLRVWFLDADTRMNPHLEYAQAIPGHNQGRGIGIIDTHRFVELIDHVGLIQTSAAWTAADQRGLQKWFRDYLTWLLESPHGRDEAKTRNNHGTHYDAQVVAMALFVGDEGTARKIITDRAQRRIAEQIEPDGRQPLELGRTKSFDYSIFNLRAWCMLARLAEHLHIDLWHYQTDDGRGIRKAIDWLGPYSDAQARWSHEQLHGPARIKLLTLLRQGAFIYRDPQYRKWIANLDAKAVDTDPSTLCYPPAE